MVAGVTRPGPMDILVTGAAGMIGRKLLERLARDGGVGGRPIGRVVLQDVVAAEPPAGAPFVCETVVSDFAAPGEAARLVAQRPELVIHLAAVVSAEAEADFDKGYRVNLDGTQRLLEAIRAVDDGYRPRVVFTSGGAVFGTPLPDPIGDEFFAAPLSSYGTQKAIGELLLADCTRRGFVDGVGLRFPTICVRPGKPNRAASGFFSSIIREPLVGQEAVLPVPDSVRHWMASPRSAIGFLLHAATMDLAVLGPRRSLNMPGLSVTVAEQIESLRRFAGDGAVRLVRREPDPMIMRIVETWPQRFDTRRAQAAGFRAEQHFDEILRAHVEDELGGNGLNRF
jgi:nucleoside-diphosphate-sugar epimerase